MTIEEYNKNLQEIRDRCRKMEKDLMLEYALANNDIKVGDILKDPCGYIVVEKISATTPFSGSTPTCVYYGPIVKKDGKPYKNGQKRWMYQTNIEEVINGKKGDDND